MGCSLLSQSENIVLSHPQRSPDKRQLLPQHCRLGAGFAGCTQLVAAVGVPCPQQLLQIHSQLGGCSWQACFLHSQHFFLSLLGLHLSAIYRSSTSGAFSWQCNSQAVHLMHYNSCEKSKWGLCIWFSCVPAPLGLLWTKCSSILNPLFCAGWHLTLVLSTLMQL